MPIPTNRSTTDPLPGNGVTTEFDFSFKVWETDEIEVWFKDGDSASEELTAGYTVNLNADQGTNPGGVVTYSIGGTPLTSSQFLTIRRAMPFTQLVDIRSMQAFSAPVMIKALDRATAERQELFEMLGRAFSVVPGEDKPEDYLNQAEAARDAAQGYAGDAAEQVTLATIQAGNSATSASDAADSAEAAESSAAMTYSELIDYKVGRRCIGSDGNLYNARKPNGPNLGGAIDPVGDTTLTWTTTEPIQVGELIELSYVPSAQELLTRRLITGSAQILADADYPEILAKWGGKIYGAPPGQESTHFYAPLYDGMFKRIWANGSENDPDRATRKDREGNVVGDVMASVQPWQIQEHDHPQGLSSGGSFPAPGGGAFSPSATGAVGGNQTNPINIYVWGGMFY